MRFRFKIMLTMTCILSLLFGAGGGVMIAGSFRSALEREKETAFRSFQLVFNALTAAQPVAEDLPGLISQLSASGGAGWSSLRLTGRGETIAAFGRVRELSGPRNVKPGGCEIRVAEGTLQLSGSLLVDGQILQMDMGCDLQPLYESRRGQRTAFRWIFLCMTVLCMLFSYISAWFLTLPLNSLSRASRKLANGNFSYRPKIAASGEIGEVAADFSRMADKLEDSFRELEDTLDRQDRFMGSFAHELKTPMTSIIGYADLLRAQTLDQNEQMEAANYIVSEGKRLEALSHKLLDLLVLREGVVLSPVSPGKLLEETIARLRPIYAAQNVTLRCRTAPGMCMLEPDLFRSLALNLLDNARKALDGGGEIRVALNMTETGCRLSVTDNGRGIPPDALAHLTEAFYRVDKSRSRKQGGAGLGLSLCHEIAVLHNGSLTFESEPGRGSCVRAELKGGRV